MTKRLEEIKRLNAERTQGEWVARKTATNRRKEVFDSYPIVDAEFTNGTLREVCRSVYTMNEDINNASFIAAAPSMADILTKLAEFEVSEEFCRKVESRYRALKCHDFHPISEYQSVINQLKDEL
jgi:hypothetical protein